MTRGIAGKGLYSDLGENNRKRDGRKTVDKEQLDYTIYQIKKDLFSPYAMSNEELAEEMFPFIRHHFKEAKLIKAGII